MSTSQSLPIQVSLPAKPGNSSVSVQADVSDTDSKGVFGGVLSDELDSVSATDAVKTVINDEVVVEEAISLSLPLDGNSLPLAINTQLQADIAELEEIIPEDLTLSTDPVDILGEVLALVESPLKATVTAIVKDAVLSQQAAVPTPADSIRFINNPVLANSKTEASNQSVSLLPFTDLGIDAETQAVTQFKESLQLQKIFSPLTRQAEVSIEVGQSGRILEQFPELNSKLVVTPTVSNIVNSTPLNGTAAGTTIGTTAMAQLSVDVPVQDQRWQKAFSQRVVWSVGNAQSAQLRLNPAELGRIDIQVNIDNDKANVVFTTQQGVVKEAIEQALPRLRDMLAEQGVDLENVEIFQDNFNQGQAGTNNGSSQQQEVENRQWSASSDDEQVDEKVFVSNIMIKDDVVDFYV